MKLTPRTRPGIAIGTKAMKSSSPRPRRRVFVVIHAMTAVRAIVTVAAVTPSSRLFRTPSRALGCSKTNR